MRSFLRSVTLSFVSLPGAVAACFLAWSAPARAQDPPPAKPAPILDVATDPPAEGEAHGSPAAARKPGEKEGKEGSKEAKRKEEKEKEPAAEVNTFGLQLSSTHAPGYSNPGLAASAAMHTVRFENRERSSDYSRANLAIGGGTAGFEGTLDAMVASGHLSRIGKDEGVVTRFGLQGWLWGNHQLYSSLFSLPEGQLGFQVKRGASLFEIGGHAGFVMVGRYRPGREESRKLGESADFGAYAAFHFSPFHLDLDYVRVDTLREQAGSAVDSLRGSLCLTPSALSLCFHADWLHGSTAGGSSRAYDSVYTGMLIGFSPS